VDWSANATFLDDNVIKVLNVPYRLSRVAGLMLSWRRSVTPSLLGQACDPRNFQSVGFVFRH
jgi:hypothetical protein